jgi:hypothetical protein
MEPSPPWPGAGRTGARRVHSDTSRFLRLHSFEFLIFVILFILLAMCLAAAPLVTKDAPADVAALARWSAAGPAH